MESLSSSSGLLYLSLHLREASEEEEDLEDEEER